MAIFHLPPAQTTGGAQPYGDNKLPPSLDLVPNPPFGYGGPIAVDAAIIAAAQPDPWTYAYLGPARGGQPYGPRQLFPALLGVQTDNPPFTFGGPVAEDAEIIGLAQSDPWQYVYNGLAGGRQPYGRPSLTPSLLIVPEPPHQYGGLFAVNASVVAAAQPDPWTYVYNGPVGGTQPYAQRQLSPAIPGQSADPPPFDRRRPEQGVEAIALTQPDPWVYAFFGSTAPFRPKQLSPGIPGQSADPPPFSFGGPIAEDAEIIGIAQPDPWVYVYNGLASGAQPYAPRKLSPAIPGQSADQPPFKYGGPIAVGAETIGLAQPDPWTFTFFGNTAPFAPKQISPGVPGQSVDKPPFKYGGPVAVNAEVVGATQPDPWTYTFFGSTAPFAPKKLSPGIPGQSVNNPPFKYGGPVAVNASIAAITQPDPWQYVYNGLTSGSQPYAPRKLPPTVTAVQVDNPPFTHGGRTGVQASVVATAQPDPWVYPFIGSQPYAGRGTLVQPFVPFLPDTRFAKIAASIIAIWQPDPWSYVYGGAQPYSPKQLGPLAVPPVVNNPPFDRRRSEQSAEAITLNQPELWTYTFMGGAQPYAPAPINPIFEGLIIPPPGSGKRKNFPSYIPQPAYDEKPRKPIRPIWDRQRKTPYIAPDIAPIPRPPQEIFRGPPRVISPGGLPTFSEYTPNDPAAMARQMHEAHELAEAHAAVRAMQAAQAQQANTDEQDMADALAALKALGILKG